MHADLKKALLLLAAAGVLAVGVNLVRPDPLPWLATPEARILTQAAELAPLKPETAAWVDIRDREAFAAGHAAGAVNLPVRQKFQYVMRVFEMLAPQGPIIVYGNSGQEADGREAAGFLIDNGYEADQIYIFAPGWEGMEKLDTLSKAKGEQL